MRLRPAAHPARPFHGDHGAVGLRQVHADALHGGPGCSHRGSGVDRRDRAEPPERQAPDGAAAGPGRVRVPDVQLDPHVERVGEHDASAGHRWAQTGPSLAEHGGRHIGVAAPSHSSTGGAVRWAAAARGLCPCAREPASDHLRRRADRKPGPSERRRGARLPAPVGAGDGADRRHGHARSECGGVRRPGDLLDETVSLDYTAGSTAGLAGAGLLVDRTTADSHSWSVGDAVEALLPNGKALDLTVGGIYEPNQVVGSLVVPLEAYEAAGGPALDQYVYVDFAEGVAAATVRPALESVVAEYPVVALKDQGEFRAELEGTVDQMLMLINALLVLSLLIAVLGIINTLALAVIERTREIGLLRAVGMGRVQLRRMIRLESVIISLYGSVLGVALGVVLGVALTRSLSAQGIDVVSIPVGRIGLFIAAAVVIGVLAALWPARRAARLQILDAIATT